MSGDKDIKKLHIANLIAVKLGNHQSKKANENNSDNKHFLSTKLKKINSLTRERGEQSTELRCSL